MTAGALDAANFLRRHTRKKNWTQTRFANTVYFVAKSNIIQYIIVHANSSQKYIAIY